jgi:hypothetical protein
VSEEEVSDEEEEDVQVTTQYTRNDSEIAPLSQPLTPAPGLRIHRFAGVLVLPSLFVLTSSLRCLSRAARFLDLFFSHHFLVADQQTGQN